MSCTLDNFKENFPTLNKERNNITDFKDYRALYQYTMQVETKAKEQGFVSDKPMFSVEQVNSDELSGNRDYTNSQRTLTFLNINEDVIRYYDAFVEESLLAELYEDDYVENSMTEIGNIFQDDSFMNEEDFLDDSDDFSSTDILHSSMPFDPDNEETEVFDSPINFREWKETRVTLLNKLKKVKNRLINTKQSTKIKEINKVISNLEKELEDFDENNATFIHSNVIRELSVLDDFLELNITDPVTAANMLETNQIRERIEALELAFADGTSMEGDVYNFNAGLNVQQVNELKAKIADLRKNYNAALENMIFNLIANDDLVLQQKQAFEEAGKGKEFEKFLEKVKNLLDTQDITEKIDGDGLGKNFLGAGSYDSLLAELIIITRDMNSNKEAGITNLWRKQLKDSYDKIKNHKIGDTYFIDKLFQKDAFGINNQKLINYITPLFDNLRKTFNSTRNDFFKAKKDAKNEAYSDWMDMLKDNVDFIDARKLPEFIEKYKDHSDFKDFLTFSTVEAEAYKKELQESLGMVAYELEVQKQIKKIENFLDDEFNTVQAKYQNNPLSFLRNFYSDNYNQKEISTDMHALPTYLDYIPKLSEPSFYNQDFKNLEKENVDGFRDFYISAKNLIDYTREAGRASGVNIGWNDIISLKDSAGREAKKNLSYWGGVRLDLMTMLRGMFDSFVDANLENADNDSSYDKSKRKMSTGYSNYGEKQIREMSEALAKRSVNELIKVGEKEGLSIPKDFKDDTVRNRQEIAQSIARNRINKSSSLDLFKRISYGASIAESINTRQNTNNIINIVKDYAKTNQLANTTSFVNVWEANNILKPGMLDHGALSKYERNKITLFGKKYNDAERELKKVYEEEKKNMNGDYDFTHNDYKYSRDSQGNHIKKKLGEDVKIPGIPITTREIEQAYEESLNSKIEALGKYPTGASMMMGFAWNMYRSYLWFSLPSGWKNRMAGYNQNNEAAASGLHGFTVDNLVSARRLLGGSNIRKTLNYTGLPKRLGLKNTQKAQQVDVLLHLVESLGLLENVMQDVDGGDGSVNAITGTGAYNKFKEIMSDFAMNNPEFHNQMELLVAMMQNVDIEVVGGGTRKLYDPKTRTFPFDPKTMKLLPEFDTENNRKNWEEFTTNDEGKAPQNLLIQKYTNVKHKLHGNYRTDDKIGIQSTATGRASTAFMKWAYENLNNQYGTKKVSLATAEINIKGRKIPLLTRFPTLITHILLQNGVRGSVIGAGVSILGLGTTGAAITIGGVILPLSVLTYMIVKNRKNISFAQQDFKLAGQYALEVLMRSLKTSINTTTRVGVVSNKLGLTEDRIKRWSGVHEATYKNRNTDLKTRQLISESAQEVANKYNMAIQFAITGLVLKGLYTLASGIAGDDDEEKEARLQGLEQKLNYLINIKNSVSADMEKWTDPAKLKDTYDQVILLDFLMRSWDNFVKAPTQVANGDISEEEMYYKMFQSISGPVFGMPRKVLEVADPGKSMFSDKRIYDNASKNFIDTWLIDSNLEGEEYYKRQVNRERARTRKKVESIIKKRLRDEFEAQGREDFYKIDDLIKPNIDKLYKETDTKYNKKKNNYQKLHENADWDYVKNRSKEMNLITKEK